MKRDLLKEHGFSEEQINFVMAENGKDVNSLKEQINNLTGERDGLQKQIEDRDKQLNTLKKSSKDNDELQSQIKQLQNENKTAKQNYQDQLAKQNKSFKIEGALRDAKAKNIKTVLPLIDTEKVSVNDDGTLNGYSITSISETPGLGVLVQEEPFYSQFEGKAEETYTVVKTAPAAENEIQAVTGATISSRAVTNGVNACLLYFRSALQGGN